jgi:hypothetical protein
MRDSDVNSKSFAYISLEEGAMQVRSSDEGANVRALGYRERRDIVVVGHCPIGNGVSHIG